MMQKRDYLQQYPELGSQQETSSRECLPAFSLSAILSTTVERPRRLDAPREKSVWLNINGSGITAQLDTMMNPIQRGQLFFKLLMRKPNEELQAKTYEQDSCFARVAGTQGTSITRRYG
jgi:hypothetical protein